MAEILISFAGYLVSALFIVCGVYCFWIKEPFRITLAAFVLGIVAAVVTKFLLKVIA